MTGFEITLIIIGVIFVLGSFFVQENLSQKDIQSIADRSENEIRMIMDSQLNKVRSEIEYRVNEVAEETSSITRRALEKETNDKIMAINEYSDTVLESIHKSHEEIMFLYSMLNDKHNELTELAGQLTEFSAGIKKTKQKVLEELTNSANELRQNVDSQSQESAEKEEIAQAVGLQEGSEENHSNEILRLYKEGMSAVEIAKRMDVGLGEIKLVINLYRGDSSNEA